MTEEHAISLCLRHHDPIGFEYLVNRYRREAFFHALSYLKNRDEAADACQESFSRAFTAMPRLKKLDRFYPWFYTILKHCCLNMLRKQNKVDRHAEHPQQFMDALIFPTTPDQEMESGEEQTRIHRALAALKPEFRQILMLKYAEEKDYNAIARLLNIPRGTVMSRLYHARKGFHQKYLEGEKDE